MDIVWIGYDVPMTYQDSGGPLGPLRTNHRIKMILENSTKYIDLMDDADIDRLLGAIERMNTVNGLDDLESSDPPERIVDNSS